MNTIPLPALRLAPSQTNERRRSNTIDELGVNDPTPNPGRTTRFAGRDVAAMPNRDANTARTIDINHPVAVPPREHRESRRHAPAAEPGP